MRVWYEKRACTDPSVSRGERIRWLLGTTQVISASSAWRLLVLSGCHEAASSAWPVTRLTRLQPDTLGPKPMPGHSCPPPWASLSILGMRCQEPVHQPGVHNSGVWGSYFPLGKTYGIWVPEDKYVFPSSWSVLTSRASDEHPEDSPIILSHHVSS